MLNLLVRFLCNCCLLAKLGPPIKIIIDYWIILKINLACKTVRSVCADQWLDFATFLPPVSCTSSSNPLFLLSYLPDYSETRTISGSHTYVSVKQEVDLPSVPPPHPILPFVWFINQPSLCKFHMMLHNETGWGLPYNFHTVHLNQLVGVSP